MAASIVGSEPPSQTSTPKPVQPRPSARRNNRTSLYHPPASAQGNGAPEVYWSEGATPSGYSRGDEGESYTFYREPTPEPQEKRRTGVGIDTPSDDEAGFGRWAGKARLNRRMCGVRAWVFWGIVALVLIVLTGVGVGVGVGMSSGGTSAAAAASEAEPSSPLSASPTTSATTELGTMTIERCVHAYGQPDTRALLTTLQLAVGKHGVRDAGPNNSVSIERRGVSHGHESRFPHMSRVQLHPLRRPRLQHTFPTALWRRLPITAGRRRYSYSVDRKHGRMHAELRRHPRMHRQRLGPRRRGLLVEERLDNRESQ
ncbi:uncharacterized protein VDAG_10510 [Verticillium dahliae VdLs.17]|uniref:Uncharacterized protein n=1 Tax=Verticillium dahliae (strain VdLs.17 / ATCC MYA-4575 / FGSC 10137) TaxID=498257 RepID=G2XK28_VERDV|nr:uncharacterized protein VDAG_10510 [Verticillium dahliae VdLs.17]EGY21528.1 hypothetical protein VDAG_10510 [Verticillium dahliae VdLs.17]KAH6700072.1 hypothetical protein EV126DRAFT_341809 [Verticillium dahliae]